MASAEITFSGKGEAGMYRTAKTAAVAAVAGRDFKAVTTGAAADDALTAELTTALRTGRTLQNWLLTLLQQQRSRRTSVNVDVL